MKPRPHTLSAWLDRRRRKWVAWWGGRFRRLRDVDARTIALFCDCEGHYAGADGEVCADRGLDALLDLLARQHLHITFNIVADLCRTHPQRVRRIAEAGHEIACHGLRHERPRDYGDELDDMLEEAQACFGSLGLRATGFRSPQSAWSLQLMQRLSAQGFAWSAERDRAPAPYRLVNQLVRVPVLLDDWPLAERKMSPQALMHAWHDQIGRAVQQGRVVSVGVHEWLLGREPGFAPVLSDHLEWLHQILELKISSIGTLVKVAPTRPVSGPS